MKPKLFTIENEDCLEGMEKLDAKCFDYAFTSPPYNRKRNDKYELYDDIRDDYYYFVCRCIEEMLRITKNHVFVNIQTNYYNRSAVYKLIGNYCEKIQNIIIWEKSNPLPASGHNITNAYELFLILGEAPIKSSTTYTKNIITTSVNSESTTKIHKAVMKQEVADWMFEKFIPAKSTVIDPMMGLGTTAVAAEKYGCSWFGYEIVPKYVNKAWERIISSRRMLTNNKIGDIINAERE